MTNTARNSLIERLYISTVSEDAVELSKSCGMGLEIAEYCTAYNMDEYLEETDRTVRAEMAHTDRFVFHAPFNELCPAAIDPKVLAITRERYEQAYRLCSSYGIRRMVCHSGYVPLVYFKTWFHDRSVEFWTDFLKDKPADFTVCLENVLEDEPHMLTEIVKAVNDPRFRLCLDIGHANTFVSEIPLSQWIDVNGPYIGHLHIHNNEGGWDVHDPLPTGNIPMEETLNHLLSLVPDDTTITLETLQSRSSVQWLMDHHFIERRQ